MTATPCLFRKLRAIIFLPSLSRKADLQETIFCKLGGKLSSRGAGLSMFNNDHKLLAIRIMLMSILLTGLFGVTPASAEPISKPGFSNDNDTLKSDESASVSFQADNWDVQSDSVRSPIFSPNRNEPFSSLAATTIGNWSALGSNLAGTDGAISNPQYSVWDIAVSGTDVYVVGCFVNVGGDPTADNVAKFSKSLLFSIPLLV